MVKNINLGSKLFRNLTLNSAMLKALNLTKQEVAMGYIEKTENGEKFVTSKGRHIEMETNLKKVKKETKFVVKLDLNLQEIQNRTYKDLLNDPTMLPQLQPSLSLENKCSFLHLQVTLTSSAVRAQLNSKMIFEYSSQNFVYDDDSNSEGGLLLTTVNTRNCRSTFHGLYRTDSFGGFRQLNWELDAIQPRSLVILASLNDGSLLLNHTTREKLAHQGSFWSNLYSSKDSWFYLFINKGPNLHEVITPSVLPSMKTGSPFNIDVTLSGDSCYEWPFTERWNARRIFCNLHQDFKELCDCKNPLLFPARKEGKMDVQNDIPLSISTSVNRSRHMYRILQILGSSKRISADLILISMDAFDPISAMIAFVLEIKIIYRRSVGSVVSKISQAAKFTLFNQLQLFPRAKSFIFLDDDVLLSKDFYQFMQKTSSVFELDKTIWCVSGFNFFAYPHTSFDPLRLYRGMKYPLWGWMMPRYILEEILPKWLPPEMDVDWDLYILRDEIRKGRECVVPEILRSVHGPSNGAHVHNNIHTERHLYQRNLNTESVNDKLQSLERIAKTKYRDRLLHAVRSSIPVTVKFAHDISPQKFQVNSYVIFLNKTSKHYRIASRIIQRKFEVWDGDANMDIIEFKYYKSRILIIVFPSLEQLTIPENYVFYSPSESEMEDFYREREDLQQIPRAKFHKMNNFHVLDLEETFYNTKIHNEYIHRQWSKSIN